MKRRILIVSRSTTYHRGSGGMETSMDDLVATLHSAGAQTALVTTRTDANIPCDRHDAVWTIPTSRPGRYSRAWWQQTRAGDEWWNWNPDVVIGIGDSASSMLSVARARKVPVVSHNHGTTIDEARSAMATRTVRGAAQAVLNIVRTFPRARSLRGYTQIWTVSSELARQLSRPPYSVDRSRVHHVPNTIPNATFAFDQHARSRVRRAAGFDAASKVGVFAGRLDYQKGADLAVNAILRAPEHNLLVVGDGPARLQLEELARGHARGSAIVFLGRVSPAAVADALSASDYFVFPTRRREGFPMITLEAAASGLPIIASRGARVPPEIQHSRITASVNDLLAAVLSVEIRDPSRRDSSLPDLYQTGSNSKLLDQLLGDMT